MKIERTKHKVRCDMPCCKRDAGYALVPQGAMPRNYIYLCEECLSDMYCEIGKIVVPKSPQNVFERDRERRKK